MKSNTSEQKTKHTPGPCQVWPTHWAGGSESVKIDGRPTVWIDSPRGELARIKPNGGRVDALVYADAHLIAAAFNSATKAAEMGFDGQAAVESLPELLAALKRAEAALEDIRTHWAPMATYSQAQAMKKDAERDHEVISAAISKARKS